ncbi:mycothiol synthase [Streptomyces capparidis]
MSTSAGPDRSIDTRDELSDDLARAVTELIEEAAAHDGRSPVSEQGLLHLRRPREGVRHLLLRDRGGELTGYAQLEDTDPVEAPAAEMVIRPGHRCLGHGRALGGALLAVSGKRLRVWAHGGHPAARRLAGALGLTLFRELRQMRRPLEGGPAVPEPALPEGVSVRTFRPGRDEDAWLAVNAAAFAHHPEQGSWGPRDLADRMAEPWFDPEGFFLAERDGRLVGFHWTKIHKAERLGEIYVLGVHPSQQGTGLGKALTAVGLRHLARTQPTAMLYVDADNTAAVTVYERMGFTVHDVDLMYRTET